MKPKFLSALPLVLIALWAAQVAGVAWASPLQTPISWDGGGDGSSWSDPANWNPDGVPTAGDDVEITTNVTINLDVPAEVNNLILSTATLEGSSDLTIGGLFTWSSGTIQGSGEVTANGGASLTSSGTKTLIGRTLNLAGATTVAGGDSLLATNSTASGGTLSLGDGAVVNNLAGHGFVIEGAFDVLLDSPEANGVFNNAGSLTMNGGSTTATMGAPFNQTGTAQVQSGTFRLDAGGTGTGPFTISDRLEIGGGTFEFDPGASLGGAGEFRISGGEANFNFELASFSGTTTVAGGSLNFNDTATLVQLNVGGGTVAANDTLTVTGPTTMTGGGFSGSGQINANGGITFNSTGDVTLDGTVDAGDFSTWQRGDINLSNGGGIVIDPGATFSANLSDTFNITDDGDDTLVENFDVQGTLEIVGSPLVPPGIDVNVIVAPAGTIQLDPNTGLDLGGTSDVQGTITIDASSILQLDAGTHTVTNAVIDGPGTFEIAQVGTASQAFFEGDNTVNADVFFNGGIFRGTGNTTVNGTTTFGGGGGFDGSGGTYIADGGLFVNPAGSTDVTTIAGYTVRIGGTNSVWEQGSIGLANGAQLVIPPDTRLAIDHSISNISLFDDNSAQQEEFLIQGTLEVTDTGPFPPKLDTLVTVDPGGEILLDDGMSIKFTDTSANNGAIDLGTTGFVQYQFSGSHINGPAGVFQGTGTVQESSGANLDNQGTFAPGGGEVGTIFFDGSFVNSTLNIDIAAVDSHDLLALTTGSATFVGELNVTFLDDFMPPVGAEFTIVTCAGTCNGLFATINSPPGYILEAINSGNSIVVRVVDKWPLLPSPHQNPKINPDPGAATCTSLNSGCPETASLTGVVDPVYLHSGEFYLEETDLRIPGRGFDYQFTRTYKSQIQYEGPLGHNWQHNYDYYLLQEGTNIVAVNGYARSDTYTSADGVTFTSPSGFYTQLIQNPDGTYTLRNRHGGQATFNAFDGAPAEGKLASLSDRNGNTMTFDYDALGRLSQVVDTLGRTIDYEYNPEGLLDHIQDFTGRQVSFTYDANRDLVAVTGPAVTGTPNSNDFPAGKTWQYTYASGFGDERLNHNLLSIIAPNEVADGSLTPRVVNTYATDPAEYDFDRVTQQVWGGTNASGVPAGGTVTLTYEELNPGGDPNDLALPRNRTTVVDRNGNQKVYEHNVNGQRVSLKEFSNRDLRAGDPDFWETTYEYNADGRRTRTVYPAGNSVERAFDEANPDRFQQSNLLSETRTPDAGRGGDQTSIQTTYTYEPIYNRVRTVTEPRGNDAGYTPQNGGANSAARYTTTYTFDYEEACDTAAIAARTGRAEADVQQLLSDAGMCAAPLGDVNGDGVTDQVNGNVIRVQRPTVNLLASSNQAGIEGNTTQEIVELRAYNPFGQQTYLIDAEGNVTDYAYFPATDPDGDGTDTPAPPDGRTLDATTGGYLHETRQDSREITGAGIPERRNRPLCPTDLDGDGQMGVGDIQLTAALFRQEVSFPVDRNGNRRGDVQDVMWFVTRFGEVCQGFADIVNQWFYDPVGNVVRRVDGRGIATDYAVNQLNQVVQTTRAAAHDVFTPDPTEPLTLTDFGYLTHTFYDHNDNVVLRQVEDRGNTSDVDGNPPAPDLPTTAPDPDPAGGPAFVDTVYKYDILDNRIETLQEVDNDGAEFLRTRYRYDPNANPVLTILPEGNATASVYDERDLLFQSTRGATAPPALAQLAAGDPTDYDVRGGMPSPATYHYDLNGNLIEAVDAADTDGSADNNSDLGGTGDRTRYLYDGFDRRTSVVDSVGNQTVTQYDPAGNVVRVARFGPTGGPSPTTDGPDSLVTPVSDSGVIQSANLVNTDLLAATEYSYDELSRQFQTDQVLFVNTIATVRSPDVADGAGDIGKGNLTPGDDGAIPGVAGVTILGRVTTRTEYDRSSRVTFSVEDDGDTTQYAYDGADRLIRTVDPEGNRVETAYDDNDNVIERRETDISQVAGVSEERFLTTYFYDSLNRLQRQVDNLGQTTDYRYDSRNNRVATDDAQGPLTGSFIDRRAFAGGPLTTSDVNDFGNVTLTFYDGLNRRIRSQQILTASGAGDGVNAGADLFGVKGTTPAPDPSQAGGDGIITLRQDWDGNSLLASLTDDNGNQTQYTYDNLNRRLTETKGVCVAPNLADSCDPPTTVTTEYDPDDNAVRVTDENGSVFDHTYDALNRLTATAITRAAGVTGTTAQERQYDGLSRLTRATDDNEPGDTGDDSVVTFAYDSLSRVIEETQQIGGLPARAVSSGWRAAGLRSALTYPNGRALDYTYDLLDRLDTVADPGAADPIADYAYVGRGRVLERAYPLNGTRLTHLDDAGTTDVGYDGLRRTTQLRNLRDDGSLVAGFTHSYDRMNNKSTEDKLHDGANGETYTYDAAYRLVEFDRPDAGALAPLHGQWTLDGAGNWQQVDGETRQHSSFNEVIQRDATAIGSDDNGNLTDDGTLTYQWDAGNRLRTATRKSDSALIGTYAYDALGRRVRKVVGNSGALDGTTDFYYAGWQVLEERDGADALVQQFVYGNYIDEPLVLDRNQDGDGSAVGAGDRRLFYHQNTLVSVFALTDESGAVVEGYQYDAYGRPTVFGPGANGVVDFGGDDAVTPGGASAEGNPYLYTGRRLDPETGLYFYRARYYNTELGRFIGRDPIGFGAGDPNLYRYVNGNPVNSQDPAGLEDLAQEIYEYNKDWVDAVGIGGAAGFGIPGGYFAFFATVVIDSAMHAPARGYDDSLSEDIDFLEMLIRDLDPEDLEDDVRRAPSADPVLFDASDAAVNGRRPQDTSVSINLSSGMDQLRLNASQSAGKGSLLGRSLFGDPISEGNSEIVGAIARIQDQVLSGKMEPSAGRASILGLNLLQGLIDSFGGPPKDDEELEELQDGECIL